MQDDPQTPHEHTKQQIAAGFGRAAATYDRVGPSFFTHFGQRLVELAQPAQGERVLDVAAGRGAILFPVADRIGAQGHAVGIDLSEQMVQETRAELARRTVSNAEMLQMDAEQLAFPDVSFDGVFCGFALFFLPHPDAALHEYIRVLKPGGYIAVSIWGKDDPRWSWLGDLLKTFPISWDALPWFQYQQALDTEEKLRAVLTRAVFQDLRFETEEQKFLYGNEEEWWAVLWSHGMRHILETLSAADLLAFKTAAFRRMAAIKQPDGFPEVDTAVLACGKKPV